MQRLPLLLSLALGFVFASGCSSRGSLAPAYEGTGSGVSVDVETLPVGATITVNGYRAGDAPVRIQLRVTEGGELPDDVQIVADYHTTGATARNVQDITSVTLRKGTTPPATIRFRGMNVNTYGRAFN